MKFEQKGNLGRLDLLDRLIGQKYFNDDNTLSKEEMKEISYQLQKFNYLLSNLYMYENSLVNDGYGAITSILKEMEDMYRNYDSNTAEEKEFVF